MRVTEGEAFEKWCPMSRVYIGDEDGNVAANTTTQHALKSFRDTVHNASSCRSSACMMWRYSEHEEVGDLQDDVYGYCGLAGKPEIADGSEVTR